MKLKDIDAKKYPRGMVMLERLTWSDHHRPAIDEKLNFNWDKDRHYSTDQVEKASIDEMIQSLQDKREELLNTKKVLKEKDVKIALVKGRTYYQEDEPSYNWYLFRKETDEEYINRVSEDLESSRLAKENQEEWQRKQYEELKKKFG